MWCPFKALSVIELRVIVYTCPLSPVLQLPGAPTALQDLFDLLFWVLVVDYRQWGFLVLTRQWVPWVLAQELWCKDFVKLVVFWKLQAVGMAHLLRDLVWAFVLVT